ncbi:MAG: RidA family protein [Sporichthyaceae bacterium]
MSARLERLAELGLHLPEVPAPVAAYIPAVRTGNLVYIAGQLPFVEGKLLLTGKVGVDVSVEQAHGLAQRAALNGIAAASAILPNGIEDIVRIVRVSGFVACPPEFTKAPAVINGASELLGHVLGEAGVHARIAIGVAVLPLDAPVEIEFIAEVAS